MSDGPSILVPKRPRPLLAVWEITLACNSACVHCGSSAGRRRADELTTREALGLVEDLRALGTRTITLSGGEPLLRPDWEEIAAAARGAGIEAELMTNGLLAEEQAAAIAGAGFTSVSVSVDGPAAVHDALRGIPGALERTLEGARALASAGVRVGGVTQVGRANLGRLAEVEEILLANGFRGWQVQLTLPGGRAASMKDSACLGPGAMPALEAEIVSLIEMGGMFVQAADTIGWMSRHEPLLRTGTLRANRVWGSCQAGLRVIGITSDGTVRGCLSMPERFDEGNVRSRSLADIWNDPAGFAYNRRWRVSDLTGACRHCAYAALCRGGCTTVAWHATGTTTSNPYCLHAMEQKSRRSTES